MKLDNIKRIFISDLPPLCCWGQEELSCPWKPSSNVVCPRETILLTISTPAHSRPAILLAGFFRIEKLRFCYGNSMACCGLITRQSSKKQVDPEGKWKDMCTICIYFNPLVILKLTMSNLTLQPWPNSFFLFFAFKKIIKETLRKSLALIAWLWTFIISEGKNFSWHHQVPTVMVMLYMLF